MNSTRSATTNPTRKKRFDAGRNGTPIKAKPSIKNLKQIQPKLEKYVNSFEQKPL